MVILMLWVFSGTTAAAAVYVLDNWSQVTNWQKLGPMLLVGAILAPVVVVIAAILTWMTVFCETPEERK